MSEHRSNTEITKVTAKLKKHSAITKRNPITILDIVNFENNIGTVKIFFNVESAYYLFIKYPTNKVNVNGKNKLKWFQITPSHNPEYVTTLFLVPTN